MIHIYDTYDTYIYIHTHIYPSIYVSDRQTNGQRDMDIYIDR